MTNVVSFPNTTPVGAAPADQADERTFLHCSHCHSAHFVVEILGDGRQRVRCGLAGCELETETFVWWEGDQ